MEADLNDMLQVTHRFQKDCRYTIPIQSLGSFAVFLNCLRIHQIIKKLKYAAGHFDFVFIKCLLFYNYNK